MDTSELINRLKEHEGFRPYAYNDSLGFITVGYGRCIDRRKCKGLTQPEALYLLHNDIAECAKSLEVFDWYEIQDNVRKCAIIELVFNLGLAGFLGFKETIACLADKDYMLAAKNLLASKWAQQVGVHRSSDIAFRIEHGAYQ